MGIAQYPQVTGPFTLREQYIGQVAHCHSSASQAVTAGSDTVVPINTVDIDPYASSFNTSSHLFVAPATGYYNVHGNVIAAGSITSYRYYVQRNGAGEIFRLAQNTNTTLGLQTVCETGTRYVQLNAGDTLALRAVLQGAATMTLGGGAEAFSFLSVQQLA